MRLPCFAPCHQLRQDEMKNEVLVIVEKLPELFCGLAVKVCYFPSQQKWQTPSEEADYQTKNSSAYATNQAKVLLSGRKAEHKPDNRKKQLEKMENGKHWRLRSSDKV